MLKKYKVRFNIQMTYDVEVDARSKIEAEEPESLYDYIERPGGFYDCAWR